MISTTVVLDSTPASTPIGTIRCPKARVGYATRLGEACENVNGREGTHDAAEELETEVGLGHSTNEDDEGGTLDTGIKERGESQEDPPQHQVPTTGPEFWELQRARWLAPPSPATKSAAGPSPPSSPSVPLASVSSVSIPAPDHLATHADRGANSHEPEPGSSRAKLETLLNLPGAEENDELWKAYLASIHKNLIGGSRLRKGLKLSVVVKVLKAGWIRDGTWAAAASASSSQGQIASTSTPGTTTGAVASNSSTFLPSPYSFIKSAFRSNPSASPTSPLSTQKTLSAGSRSPPGQENRLRNDSPPRGEHGEGSEGGRESSPPKGNWPLRLGRNIANGIAAKKRSIADGARRLSDELRRNSNGVSSGNNSSALGIEGMGGRSPPKMNGEGGT